MRQRLPRLRSPAGDAHMARHRWSIVAAIDDEIVALGLAGDRFVNGGLEQPVALGQAQRGAQIGGVLLTEAHIERAGAGDADAIAALAEIVRQRRDEADPTPRPAYRVADRGPHGTRA